MSKQLSVSALFAVLASAVFALSVTPMPGHSIEAGAPTLASAPELQVSLAGH